MFQFEQPDYLWWLCTIPLITAIQFLYLKRRDQTIAGMGDPFVLQRLFHEWSRRREWLKTILFTTAIILLLIALANPQWGAKKEKVKARSADILIALDISSSMLAEDVSPNRMERAKRFLGRLVEKLKGERIGLIYFAGSAYLQMPMSTDYASAQLFIRSAGPTQAGTQGTVIADAISMARETFDADGHQKALIIISDGENHEEEAIKEAAAAREEGIYVYTLGIGSSEGAFIPITQSGRKVYKKDAAGQPIRSVPNRELLKDIARAGGGTFFMLDRRMAALDDIVDEMEKIEKREVEQRSFTDYVSYFQWFLFLAFLILIVEEIIPNFSDRKIKWKSIFGI